MIAIKTENIKQDFKKFADKVTQGEKVLISRPKNENIVMISESEYNELDKLRQQSMIKTKGRAKIKDAVQAIREQSELNGTSEMTMDEISDIVDEVKNN